MVTGPFAQSSCGLLQAALEYWVAQGYAYVDLPWIVDRCYVEATCPPGRLGFETPGGFLVASGEQSFLKLASEDRLPESPGYIGWTPCFREEPVIDRLHQLGFMKAELYIPVASQKAGVDVLPPLLNAQAVLFDELARSRGFHSATMTTEVLGDLQTDILLNDIEVGSYGVRKFGSLNYVYGTALALPRFTQALR